MQIRPDSGSEISSRLTPPIRSSPVEEWFDTEAYGLESRHQPELNLSKPLS